MAFNHSPKIVTDGLVLHLDAASPKSYVSGGTVWTDLSRSGNNGTLTNGPTFSAANGGSIVFDGVNDYITTPTAVFLKGSYFIWIKPLVNLTSSSGRKDFLSTTGGPYLTYNADGPGVLQYLMYNLSEQPFSASISSFEFYANTWYHLCGLHSNNKVELYLNGKLLQSSSANITDLWSTPSLTHISKTSWTNGGYWSGSVASFMAYNRTLTQQEILQNYRATKARFNL